MLEERFINQIRREIIGVGTKVPVRNGRHFKYINFDNAASTPIFRKVYYKVKEFLNWYSNVHRGSGFKSQLATEVYDKIRKLVANFVGANFEDNRIIFLKNTTEAINKLATTLNLTKDDVVITTPMEHHSNLLPWRDKAEVVYTKLDEDGKLDINDLEKKLVTYESRVELVAVTGASNVTGYLNPIHKIARLAHKYNSQILVDGAQLIPHRPVDMKDNSKAEHIDYLAFSAHKMYAPLGCGVLIGPKSSFAGQKPDYSGGGTIKAVTLDDVIWAESPDKEEAGTPNIIGAVALGASIKMIKKIGWKSLIEQEERLRKYLLKQLQQLEGVKLYGAMIKEIPKKQVGVISFNLESLHHSLVAAILSKEWGIGVRSGCFCAQPYLHRLLDLSKNKVEEYKEKLVRNENIKRPGLVRVSFGCYNTSKEVKRLIKGVQSIIERQENGFDFTTEYEFDSESGEYRPKEEVNLRKYFKL
ncbi:aminotransferase class V-fold PLP-dependent enzyme [Sporohalobacter salinus]|uniref:aminotransferase class V-fold PLP-dependent enzyme n=1 Tax=Sporohalobacter salinus TaxID=1494606 RepID=UPI00195F3FC6|nr:aminotransferase class V-fold PLP-dependent enzyme [Sporohalobacter salinus]MBM7623167.1 selenocysteine lyase/cysteine desulfurase [Sporohalobacter salinus]